MPSLAEMLAKSRAEKEKKANVDIRSDQKATGASTVEEIVGTNTNGNTEQTAAAKPSAGILGNLVRNRTSGASTIASSDNKTSGSEPAKPQNGQVVGNSILAGFGKPNANTQESNSKGNTERSIPFANTKIIPQVGETPVKVAPKVTEKITVPVEVPEDQKIAVEELTGQLNYLIENIDDKDLIGPVIRNILAKLQASPELCVFVPYQGMNQIVRGIRASFKFEALKSDEKRDKKSKTNEKVSKLASAFADAGFKLG